MYRGMLIKNAASRIAKPRMPEMIPPTKGINPIKLTIGEKKRYMPKTMQRNDKILMHLVKYSDFSMAFWKIAYLYIFYS